MEEATPPTLRFDLQNREATYRVTTLPLPPPPPAEYYVKESEHMPFLAFKFMEDSTQWWRIAEVNVPDLVPLDMPAGTYIRMPADEHDRACSARSRRADERHVDAHRSSA